MVFFLVDINKIYKKLLFLYYIYTIYNRFNASVAIVKLTTVK